MPRTELAKKLDEIIDARERFKMEVESATLETIEQAKHVSEALGEISIIEAKIAIAGYFRERLFAKSYHGVFQGKKK